DLVNLVEVAQRQDKPRRVGQDGEGVAAPLHDATEPEVRLEERARPRDVRDGQVDVIQAHIRNSLRLVGIDVQASPGLKSGRGVGNSARSAMHRARSETTGPPGAIGDPRSARRWRRDRLTGRQASMARALGSPKPAAMSQMKPGKRVSGIRNRAPGITRLRLLSSPMTPRMTPEMASQRGNNRMIPAVTLIPAISRPSGTL